MNTPDYQDVEVWIAQLKQCKPLSEKDVESLCDKVCNLSFYFSFFFNC